MGDLRRKDKYYGRHFFYRSLSGQLYTLTVPPLGNVGIQPHETLAFADYPTLRNTGEFLDGIGTRLYANATIPITLAHQYAAYPLAAAGRVLKLDAEEHLDKGEAVEDECEFTAATSPLGSSASTMIATVASPKSACRSAQPCRS